MVRFLREDLLEVHSDLGAQTEPLDKEEVWVYNLLSITLPLAQNFEVQRYFKYVELTDNQAKIVEQYII